MTINLEPHATGTSRMDGEVAALAVYVHFPWCLRKCPYCDFVSFEQDPARIDHRRYADAVLREVAHRRDILEQHRLTTVFFGGGTPSLWAPAEVGRVLRAITAAAGVVDENLEVTIECNPSSLDRAKARELAAEGVNRASVGVQGLDAKRLAFLGRWHSPDEALTALVAAVDALPRVSADLIYGVAAHEPEHAQRPEEAAAEVATVADLGVGHISAYALTIEEETKFGTLHRQGRLPLVGDDSVAESFVAVGEALRAHGFRRYEVSNFTRPGEESRHNRSYWRGDDYLGLGCAAFGTLSRPDGSAHRYRNPLTPRRYFAAAADGDFAPSFEEALSPETRLRERLMLGLRTEEGVDLTRAGRDLHLEVWSPERRERADALVAAGRLEEGDGRLRVPPQAWLYADGIAAELF